VCVSDSHFVVPAKAGTHTPQPVERLRSMGPGPRANALARDDSEESAALVPRYFASSGLYSSRLLFAILISASAALRSSFRKAANSAGESGAATTAC
jgi:hypothetical protein